MRKPRARTVAAWSALMAAQRRIAGELDRELREAHDVTIDELDALTHLRRSRRALSMSELSERVLVRGASLTRLVDGLVERGWVVRWYDDLDNRRVLVELTEEGREAQIEIVELYLDGIARMVQRPLRGHDIDQFAEALDALVAAAEAGEGHSSQRT